MLSRQVEFYDWLRQNTELSGRSLNDVVSRANRVATLTNLLAPKNDEAFVFALTQSAGYRQATPSVRSQLKRAALLYRRFAAAGDRKRK